jgi:hypothetical protein
MNQMPYPSYSPDIVPSEFFLFGQLEHKFQGCSSDLADELFSAITDLMENREKLLLRRLFDEWTSSLHFIVESSGEYIQT